MSGDITTRYELLYKGALDLGNEIRNTVMQDLKVYQHTLPDIKHKPTIFFFNFLSIIVLVSVAHAKVTSMPQYSNEKFTYYQVSADNNTGTCIEQYAGGRPFIFGFETGSAGHSLFEQHQRSVYALSDVQTAAFILVKNYHGLEHRLNSVEVSSLETEAEAILVEYASDGVLDGITGCEDYINNATRLVNSTYQSPWSGNNLATVTDCLNIGVPSFIQYGFDLSYGSLCHLKSASPNPGVSPSSIHIVKIYLVDNCSCY